MGWYKHHAILVTSQFSKDIEIAHKRAVEIFDYVSAVSPPAINCHQTFCIPPDGSKEGWPQSDDADEQRELYIDYLESLCYEDGSSPIDWCEVAYGDEVNATVLSSNSARGTGDDNERP